MTTAKDPFKEMQREISKAGGLFYQYRACRRDVNTIYDIENILRGIVTRTFGRISKYDS